MTALTNIIFDIAEPAPICFSLEQEPPLGFSLDGFALPGYDGPRTVRPTQEQQVLRTAGRSLYADIVVEPIPSNYGLITWNGSTLTVS